MLDKLIKTYQSLDEDARSVVNFLALTGDSLSINEISKAFPDIKIERLGKILKETTESQLVEKEIHYYGGYITRDLMVIWLFPLICNENTVIYERNTFVYLSHYAHPHKRLLNFLRALCFFPNLLPNAEKEFIIYCFMKNASNYVKAMFTQPAYDQHINKLSDEFVVRIYSSVLSNTIDTLDSFEQIRQIDSKMQANNSLKVNCYRAEIAMMQGDFEFARKYTAPYNEEPHKYFVEAIFAFIDNDIDKALSLFEMGMKKQRRTVRNKYLPVLPEFTLFYLSAYLAKGQDFYGLPFLRIAKERGNSPTTAYFYFQKACEYCIENMATSKQIIAYLKQASDNPPEKILWRIIAIGLTGQSLDTDVSISKYLTKACENNYYVLAYEAAFLMSKWFPNNADYKQLFDDIAAKLNYKPALSHFRHPEEWEKQLNSYFSLEPVQLVLRRDSENTKTRVAYRFFPIRNSATPILQTCNSTGVWSAGRNISIRNFGDKKIDCMTEHDKRIASKVNYYMQVLPLPAIAEMVGHPYVFLEDTNILVEFLVAQPVINVVKLPDQTYKMECDIKVPREGFILKKETNTRFKIYNLTKFQCDIINAISNSKPVPEQGHEKLRQLLIHFSVYVQVHSDMIVGENDIQIRQIAPDSRIRVQLLPIGDGIKAELFVKPFGTHPPYCKPGRGGQSLIATENGEHVRVIRNLDEESVYNERILNDIQAIENIKTSYDGLMTFVNPLNALELLDVLEQHQDISVVEWPEGERLKIRKKITFSDIHLSLKSKTNWFELDGELKVDENTIITISKLLEIVRDAHGRFVELNNGEFLALSEQLRQRLSELASCTTESKDGLLINRFASASMIDSFDNFENISVDKAWHDFRKRLQTAQFSNATVSPLLHAELRPYQISAYQWMIRLSEWGAGACLADDMGLGKTVQAIAVLLHRAHIGAALVVSPVSVMPNWVSEVNRFAPTLNVKTLRSVDREATLASLEPGDLLVTSYGLLLSEEEAITAKQWATVILDEAHAIKNYTTKTSKAAMSLQADFRMILTGTPIQNHLGEMWNLFQFINPGLLGSLSYFTDTFIRPEDEKARKSLKKLITPFILRRTKTAVLEELPPKTEIVRKITLSDEEMAFYEMLRRKAIEMLEKDDSQQGAKHMKVLAEITRLRQACCNPSLVYPEINIDSTKLSTFLEIASELKDNGHRALVFSQFVTHLSIVRKALDKAGYTYCYLDGSTPVSKRASAVRNFQNGQGDFFLISLKAGGLGLNLTAADYVIHLDPWWNPAVEDQASDRAHRFGQNRPVTVYRLVAENTIEEKIIRLHNTKRDLADSLLEGSDQSAKMSLDELMSLINN
ncbi:MAG: DEAD/DEAH box helicase [Prevotellaceae bacterium]|jgi:SNF2 family DNA or RNA helicase|nr:DEAD/DEAH box helicase [Prevotellaceae bacterium]